MIHRFLAALHARNMEFLRDRSSLGWNILFPFLLVFGLAILFSGGDRDLFKVGVLHSGVELNESLHPFFGTRYIRFFTVENQADSLKKLERHQIDMLLDFTGPAPGFWINEESPNGYVLERMLSAGSEPAIAKRLVRGAEIRYIDWVIPGILGMNMMFSCLFGVGYVVVRYRKSGFLKRLNATPLRALEFLLAQVVSRLLLITLITIGVYLGCDWVLDFRMEGSHLLLLLIAVLGSSSMISLGLLVAARVSSEELAGGVLNVVTWPMMVLSGVFFSLEGTNPAMQKFAEIFPLTQTTRAARAVMLEGAGPMDVAVELTVLLLMTLVFLALGALIFKWRAD